MEITYHIKQLEGRTDYMGYCPVMKPVSVYGKTKEEVQKKMQQALSLYLKKHPDLVQDISRTLTVKLEQRFLF